MTDTQLNANRVVKQLAELGRELDQAVAMLKDLEVEAVTKRHRADLAESKAFLDAPGPMELRKHMARVAAHNVEEEALVAEALVRHWRARIRAIDTRVEIGRSMNAALRAELAALPGTEGP